MGRIFFTAFATVRPPIPLSNIPIGATALFDIVHCSLKDKLRGKNPFLSQTGWGKFNVISIRPEITGKFMSVSGIVPSTDCGFYPQISTDQPHPLHGLIDYYMAQPMK